MPVPVRDAWTLVKRANRRSRHLFAAATFVGVLGATGCSGQATDLSAESSGSVALTQTSAATWTCPETVDSPDWPTPTHTAPGKLVPDGPRYAVDCGYEIAPSGHHSERFGPSTTYTGTALATLVTTFATATKLNPGMSCPDLDNLPRHVMRYNFVYPDGGSAVVTLSGYCPPVLSNTTLTLQPTQSPSTQPPSADAGVR
ncbi:hypothetical protein [Williamsia deligens]|uniref:LppP/LprE lipoprotein n=1 Tax=Williamsia deligens TaxID=321325 RepID=A0ABW3GB58_9NOCA|nr:hypothetical protein [Williamsia deligens]MCP2195998.1 hypothetical protein [Williamsia deligens]